MQTSLTYKGTGHSVMSYICDDTLYRLVRLVTTLCLAIVLLYDAFLTDSVSSPAHNGLNVVPPSQAADCCGAVPCFRAGKLEGNIGVEGGKEGWSGYRRTVCNINHGMMAPTACNPASADCCMP